MSLRQLRLIGAIATHGSLHRASRALGVSQPAASMLLRSAEAALGKPLFERNRSGTRLTGFGRVFVERLSIALAEIDAIEESATSDGRPLLRLGTIPRAMRSILPIALDAMLAKAPLLRISVTEGPANQLVEQLGAGLLDAVIGRDLPLDAKQLARLTFERLFDERTVVVEAGGEAHVSGRVRPASLRERRDERVTLASLRERRDERVTLASLREREWALPPRGSFARELIDSAFIAAGLPPVMPRVESAVFSSNLELVAAGSLITLAPASAAEPLARAGRVRIITLRPALPASPIYLIYRSRSGELAELQALRSALLAARAHHKAKLPPG